jgi:hypothetical protein
MQWFDRLRDHRDRLRRRVDAVAHDVRRARAETDQALRHLGFTPPTPDADVIDVEAPRHGLVGGAVRGVVRQTTRGLMLLAAAVLLGAALWSLGIFLGASLLAFVVVTRGLGLRIDVSPRPA